MVNISEIKQQFAKVISFSQNIPNPNIDNLFEEWMEAKREIIEAWDGELIKEISTPVQFHLDEKMRAVNFGNFVSTINSVFHNHRLAKFLTDNQEGFFNNTVVKAYDYDGIQVPKGMKLVKAFKFFESEKSVLDTIQSQASQVIQEDKVEGTLCFSVHPLDFLSTSVNTYNWRSCHALDGEYRAGNLSYMSDKCTIICYLRGADNVELPMFPSDVRWNSKKWRVLCYLAEGWDMIFASKQYPFNSKAGLDQVLPLLLESLKLNIHSFSEWRTDYLTHYQFENGREMYYNNLYLPINHELVAINTIVQDCEDPILHFNDVLCSSTYKKPYYSVKEMWWGCSNNPPHISVGKRVKCLCCGKRVITDSELMACRPCAEDLNLYDDDVAICSCCGSHIYNDDESIYVQGEWVCESCFSEQCFTCANCDEYYFNDDKIYDRDRDRYVCVSCYNSGG